MAATKILCVHGVGHAEQNPHWNQPWDDVIANAFKRCNRERKGRFLLERLPAVKPFF